MPYGYVVQYKIGTQWKKTTFHPTLENAVTEVFENRLRNETKNVVIRVDNLSEARRLLQALASQLTEIKQQIIIEAKQVAESLPQYASQMK